MHNLRPIYRTPVYPVVRTLLGGRRISGGLPTKDSALVWLKGDTYDAGTNVSLVDKIGSTNPPAGYDYKAQSFEFDTTTAIRDVTFAVSVPYTVSAKGIVPDTTADNRALLGSSSTSTINNFMFLAAGTLRFSTGSGAKDTAHGLSIGDLYDISFSVSSAGVGTLTVNGTVVSSSVAIGTGDLVFTQIGRKGSTVDPYNSSVWEIEIYDNENFTGNLVFYCPCTNAVGTSVPMLIDGEVAYGTLIGATLPDFYATHQDGVTGFNQNLLGFNIADTHATLTDGCIIPADPDNPTKDIEGTTLVYPGPIKKNAELTGYTGTWDGTAYLANANLVGTETVTDSNGTSTPSVSAGQIDFTAGWCSDLTLSNGDRIIIESSVTSTQTNYYSVTSSEVYVLTTATTPFCTTESEEATYLLENGWELSSGNYIPAIAAGGESAAGNALTASPGDLRTVEPGFFEMPQDKGLIAADPANEMFDGAGDSQALTYDDTDESPWLGDQLFGSDKRGRCVYDADLTGTDLTKADKYWEIT